MLALEDFRAIFMAAPDGYLVVDHDGLIVDANPKAVAMFGWSREELVGAGVEVLVPVDLRGRHQAHRREFLAHPRDRPMGVGLDLRGRRKGGSTFPVEVSLSSWQGPPEASGEEPRVICAVRDMTDHRRLRNFSEGALRASEDERRRIARELHDDTAQRLATLLLGLRGLVEEPDLEARHARWDKIRTDLVETTAGVQRIARGLRPPELDDVGLALAVRAHLRTISEHTPIDVEASLEDVEDQLSLTGKLALYRIVQEALSNVRRHADAARVQVSLWAENGRVMAEVTDDGRGFDASASPEGDRGLGLIGMRERATMVGGLVSVRSQVGGGTVVRIDLPALNPEEGRDG